MLVDNSYNHIINKVFVEVNAPSKESAFHFKDHIDVFIKKELLTKLDLYFNDLQAKNPQASIQLEKVDVEIFFDPDQGVFDIKPLLFKEVKTQIEHALDRSSIGNSKKEKIVSNKEKKEKGIIHFLETGTKSWWDLSQKANINEAILTKLQKKGIIRGINNPIQRERFIKQFSNDQISNLIDEILLEKSPVFKTKKAQTDFIKSKTEVVTKVLPKVNLEVRFLIWEILFLKVLDAEISVLNQNVIQLFTSTLKANKDYSEIVVFNEVSNLLQKNTILEIIVKFQNFLNKISKLLQVSTSLNNEVFIATKEGKGNKSRIINEITEPLVTTSNSKEKSNKNVEEKEEKKSNPHNETSVVKKALNISMIKDKTVTQQEIEAATIALISSDNKKFKTYSKQEQEDFIKRLRGAQTSINNIETDKLSKQISKTDKKSNNKIEKQEELLKTNERINVNIPDNKKQEAFKKQEEERHFQEYKNTIQNKKGIPLGKDKKPFKPNTNYEEAISLAHKFKKYKESYTQLKSQKERSQKNNTPISTNNGVYYVDNAGLILIHPFIQQLFKNCDLLKEGNQIKNIEKAVHLLHYVATKQEQQPESEMLFEKFICGVSFQTPINRFVELSGELKKNADQMLQAAIAYWPKMKNSSIDLIRNEFLTRAGKLELKTKNPKLTIERKSYDILLNKLNWNLSMARFPWLDKLLFINW